MCALARHTLYLLCGWGNPAMEISRRKLLQQFVFSLNKLQGTGSSLFLSENQKKNPPVEQTTVNTALWEWQFRQRRSRWLKSLRIDCLNTSEEGVGAAGTNYCIRIRCSALWVLQSGLLDKNRSLHQLLWIVRNTEHFQPHTALMRAGNAWSRVNVLILTSHAQF